MAHHVFRGEIIERHALDALQDTLGILQAAGRAARQVDLGAIPGDHHAAALAQPGQEHFHLHGGGILRLVQHHKRIRQGAPAHERQRRDFDPLVFHQLLHLLLRQKIIQRVVKWLHIGVDLVFHIAGQEPQSLARFNRRARQDDLFDRAGNQHRNPNRHRQIGFAGARRPDAKAHLMRKQIGDIGFLRLGAGFNRLFAGLQLHAGTREHLDLRIGVQTGAVRHRPPHADGAVNLARCHAAPAFDAGVKRAQHRCRLIAGGLVADHRQPIAPAQDMHPHLLFHLRQIAVKFTAQADQQPVVRKLQNGFDGIIGFARWGQRAEGQCGLLVRLGFTQMWGGPLGVARVDRRSRCFCDPS